MVSNCYVDADFSGKWNQEESKETGAVMYITDVVVTCTNCPIIWLIWIQTEIELSTMEVEYIALLLATRDVLSFVINIK